MSRLEVEIVVKLYQANELNSSYNTFKYLYAVFNVLKHRWLIMGMVPDYPASKHGGSVAPPSRLSSG
jgi:hypothetical protein